MTALELHMTPDMRRSMYATYARTIGRHRQTTIGPALDAIGAVIHGSETTVDVDLSSLNRKELARVRRLVLSVSELHGGHLRRFADAIEADDRAANPGANPLIYM